MITLPCRDISWNRHLGSPVYDVYGVSWKMEPLLCNNTNVNKKCSQLNISVKSCNFHVSFNMSVFNNCQHSILSPIYVITCLVKRVTNTGANYIHACHLQFLLLVLINVIYISLQCQCTLWYYIVSRSIAYTLYTDLYRIKVHTNYTLGYPWLHSQSWVHWHQTHRNQNWQISVYSLVNYYL